VIKILWIVLIIASLSLFTWLALLLGRGRFWVMDETLTPPGDAEDVNSWPPICAIIPARNESDLLPETLPTVLNQDYSGRIRLILVDDRSEDGTGDIARELARETDSETEFEVVTPPPTPDGWTGKVWALHQGFQKAKEDECQLIWLTDADISHHPDTVKTLTNKLIDEGLSLASIMADLQTKSFWEKLLIPNFVYYFSMLFPFNWVNNSNRDTTAAAGGCILVRKSALTAIGGFCAFQDAIIDDCALAREIKKEGRGLWLGLSHTSKSIRSYGSLNSIWKTISRSAFSQLNHSFFLLLGTIIGMLLLFVVPPGAVALGLAGTVITIAGMGSSLATGIAAVGGITWLVMAYSFLPILRWYGLSPSYGLLAPLGGFLYTLMTIDSAVDWWTGKGGNWKGRRYS